MTINIRDAALNHFAAILHQHPALRLTTKKTGCSGLSYVIEPITVPTAEDIYLSNNQGLPIYVDGTQLAVLDGLCIDYVQVGLQKKLHFINPNETGHCGCGESFSVT